MRGAETERRAGTRGPAGLTLVVLLLAGLALRAPSFVQPHLEGDEVIYALLVEQLERGRGYTLQGHPALDAAWMVREGYDRPVFFHPPVGIWLFLVSRKVFGPAGFEVVQLVAFAGFYVGVLWLAREALPWWTPAVGTLVAALAAFHPLVAHVGVHRWLDGPQVALVTLGAAGLLRAVRPGSHRSAAGAGALLGAACLIKLNTPLAFPGILALALAARPTPERGRVVRGAAVAFAVALALAAVWLAALAWMTGELSPGWAGRPSERLIAQNPFVRLVTVVRTPWSYLRLLPTTVWTLVPALAVLGVWRPRGRGAGVLAALVGWIGVVVGAHAGLGALGYSKLLRYVILASPATILLAGLALGRLLGDGRSPAEAPGGRLVGRVVALVVVVAAALLEVAHGIETALVYPDRAGILPLWDVLPRG